jgi:hypothetical protein
MDVTYSVTMDEPLLTNIMKFSWRFMWSRNNYVRLIFTKIKCPTNFMLDLQHQIQYDDSVTKVKHTYKTSKSTVQKSVFFAYVYVSHKGA